MMRLPVTNVPATIPTATKPSPARRAVRLARFPSASSGMAGAQRRRIARRHRSFYLSILRLNRLRPSGLQRILLIEGSLVAGIVIALADVASAWIVLVLPLLVAATVKFEDVVATALSGEGDERSGSGPDSGTRTRARHAA